MYNFTELKNNAAVILQRSGDTSYKTEIETWMNLSLFELYNSYDYFLELRGTYDFTSVDGTAVYYAPNDLDKPLRVYDITNDKKISIKTEEEYFDANIANIADAEEGDVDTLYFTEAVGVKAQVATTGDTTEVISSSASDTAIVVRVEGYLDSSLTILGYENITCNGTTAVSGTTTFYKITRYSKSGDSVGYISLRNSSSTVLAILAQTQRVSRHKVFRLGLIPDDSVTSYRVLYKKMFTKLVNAYDYPFIECDDFLIYNSASLGLQQSKETIDRATMLQNMAQYAKRGILLNQMSKLGTSYQHRIDNAFTSAHRS